MGYISVAESLGTSSTTFTQCAPEATEIGEITQNKGHYAVQGHSRSPILVPIDSSYTTSYILVINTNLPPVLHRFRDIAFDGSKIAIIFLYPSSVAPPHLRRRRSPGTMSVEVSVDVSGWPRYQMP